MSLYRPVEWLWPGRIPIGKVTLLVGDPGLGKSLARPRRRRPRHPRPALARRTPQPWRAPWATTEREIDTVTTDPHFDISASPHRLLPLRPAPSSSAPPTTKSPTPSAPASTRHGADQTASSSPPASPTCGTTSPGFARAVDRMPDCRLIIVDPVNAYVGPSDSHFHTSRPQSARAARRARRPRKRIAILAVTHLRKNDRRRAQPRHRLDGLRRRRPHRLDDRPRPRRRSAKKSASHDQPVPTAPPPSPADQSASRALTLRESTAHFDRNVSDRRTIKPDVGDPQRAFDRAAPRSIGISRGRSTWQHKCNTRNSRSIRQPLVV